MTFAGASQRRKTAYSAARAAKARRQRIIVIVGFVLFVAVMAYEVPHMLKLLKNSNNPVAAALVAAPATAATPTKHFRSGTDPFASRSLPAGDPGVGAAISGHDPFVVPSVASSTPATVAPAALPQTIILGTPGANKHASRGWIVILASIPTGEGRGSATSFATRVRAGGLAPISVLDSSNRRPLRGGYWVVYTGPYATLGEVNSAASRVHSAGYGSAYIRELIEYR